MAVEFGHAIRKVIVYAGHFVNEVVGGGVQTLLKGPYLTSFHEDLKIFQLFSDRYNRKWSVESVYAQDLRQVLAMSCLEKTVVVLPAGHASDYDLMPEETKALLQEQLSNGMIDLITTCGSAYAVAQERFWGLSVRKEGKFNFFPGIAAGPLYSDSTQPFGMDFFFKVCAVQFGSQQVNVLLGGGGSLFYKKGDSTHTLAFYKKEELESSGRDKSWENAIVVHRIGKRKIILSMVHPTTGSEEMKELESCMRSLFPSRHYDDWKLMADTVSPLGERLLLIKFMIKQLEVDG